MGIVKVQQGYKDNQIGINNEVVVKELSGCRESKVVMKEQTWPRNNKVFMKRQSRLRGNKIAMTSKVIVKEESRPRDNKVVVKRRFGATDNRVSVKEEKGVVVIDDNDVVVKDEPGGRGKEVVAQVKGKLQRHADATLVAQGTKRKRLIAATEKKGLLRLSDISESSENAAFDIPQTVY